MFAGEGDAFRTNRRFNCLSEHSEAKRLSTAFDSVTLYGRDPATPPDVYGKVGTSGVSIATLDDMKVLYAGFDLTSPTTSVSMTINGPAPTILAFFLNTAIDQQVDGFAEREGREPGGRARGAHRVRAPERPRHGAGRHPQGGPGPEHLHLLHRVQPADDGRHPGVVHPAQGAQLLLGVDLRLPHRRGRGEPDQPARVHAGQRVHLRRVLPRARDGHRRLRAEPVVLLLQRHGRRVLRDRPGRPADLGGRDARALRGERALAEAEVPRADLGAVAARAGDELQRHPHDAAGALRALRQRELAAHQRLRRGRHHPDRGVGAPRDGHPADHQPGVGPVDEREPAAGVVRHRRADRPRRGGGARRVRPIAERGGVLGAMETGYQRGRIQDESMLYEHRKHDGTLPIIGVNTFVRPEDAERAAGDRARPRHRGGEGRSSTGSPTSRPATPTPPPRRCAGCRTSPPAAATSSTSSCTRPGSAPSASSRRRSSRWAGSTGARCSRCASRR